MPQHDDIIEDVVVELLKGSVTSLPPDIIAAIEKAEREETNRTAKMNLRTILEDIEAAGCSSCPMCQDTGVHIFFVSGYVDGTMEESIRQGVARATEEIPLRPNAVHPLTRKNSRNERGQWIAAHNLLTFDG